MDTREIIIFYDRQLSQSVHHNDIGLDSITGLHTWLCLNISFTFPFDMSMMMVLQNQEEADSCYMYARVQKT
jgi:hypothetical protein